MKYIKSYKIFESSVFPTSKEEIDEICLKYNIRNYIINDDFSIDVDWYVNLSSKGLTKLPLKFNKVSGNFNCYNNKLNSLEGCPNYVGGNFDCSNSQLNSLDGCPNYVGGDFYCNNNQLSSLEGCPKVGGNFYCYDNELVNLFPLTKEPDIYINNICSKLYQTCLRDLKIPFVELNFRLEEFNCFKDNELDLISLENLYEFYNRVFNQKVFEMASIRNLPKIDISSHTPYDKLSKVINVKSLVKIVADELGYEVNTITYVASGSYGMAFKVNGENKILKLTFDRSEAYIANKIRKINTKNLINYYDVRHIEFDQEVVDNFSDKYYDLEYVYVLILDKVKTLSDEQKIIFDQLTNKVNFASPIEFITKKLESNLSKIKKNYIEYYIKAKSYKTDLINAVEECRKLDINVSDIHNNNVGIKDGKLVLFDLSTINHYDYNDSSNKLKSIKIEYAKRTKS